MTSTGRLVPRQPVPPLAVPTLDGGTWQTMPFARPSFEDVTKAIDFVLARTYPARGEVVELAEAAE